MSPERGDLRLRALQPRIRPHQAHDPLRVARDVVDFRYVDVYGCVIVLLGSFKRHFAGLLNGRRPAAPAYEVCDIVQIALHALRNFGIAILHQGGETNRSRRLKGFPQRHRPHLQPDDATRSGMCHVP